MSVRNVKNADPMSDFVRMMMFIKCPFQMCIHIEKHTVDLWTEKAVSDKSVDISVNKSAKA